MTQHVIVCIGTVWLCIEGRVYWMEDGYVLARVSAVGHGSQDLEMVHREIDAWIAWTTCHGLGPPQTLAECQHLGMQTSIWKGYTTRCLDCVDDIGFTDWASGLLQQARRGLQSGHLLPGPQCDGTKMFTTAQ